MIPSEINGDSTERSSRSVDGEGGGLAAHTRRIGLLKRIMFTCVAVVVGFAAIEVCLRLAGAVYPPLANIIAAPNLKKDAALEFRPSPNVGGFDANGFRNRAIPDKASIITLGDSQTYGYGVMPSEAWPERLAALISSAGQARATVATSKGNSQDRKRSSAIVYNMGVPGYGPVQSVRLLSEAFKFKPTLIVEGFYLGNDLYDSYHLVDFYCSSKQISGPPDSLSLEEVISRLEGLDGSAAKAPVDLTYAKLPGAAFDASSLVRMSRSLFGMAEYTFGDSPSQRVQSEVFWRLISLATLVQPQQWIFDDGKRHTIFDCEYRLRGMNLDDPQIRCGLRLSLEAMTLMRKRAADAGAQFLVVILPTKEAVFSGLAKKFYKDPAQVPESFRAVTKNENIIRSTILNYLKEQGIHYVDTRPALISCLEKTAQPYKVSIDGHPNVLGNIVIAEAAGHGIADMKTSLLHNRSE